MKRIALVAAVLVLVACSKKDDAVVDTGAAAMAPAPAAMDTGMKMIDSTAIKDSMMKDSIAKAAKK
jgi:PBP1b-binding outer membrane lipoprotein LpoB